MSTEVQSLTYGNTNKAEIVWGPWHVSHPEDDDREEVWRRLAKSQSMQCPIHKHSAHG